MKYTTLLLTITTVYASFPAEGPAHSKPTFRQKLLGELTTTIGKTKNGLAAVEKIMLHAPAYRQAALRKKKNALVRALTDTQLRHTELAIDEVKAQAALELGLQRTQVEWWAWQEEQSLPVTTYQKALADEYARQEADQNRQEIQQILAEQKQKQEAQQKAHNEQLEAAKQKARDAVGRKAAQEALAKEMLRRQQEDEAADVLRGLASLPCKKPRVQ